MLSILQKARLLHRFSTFRISSTLTTDLVQRSVVKDIHTSQSLHSDWYLGDEDEEESNSFSGANTRSRRNRHHGGDDSKYIDRGDGYRNDRNYRKHEYDRFDSGGGYRNTGGGGYRNDSYSKRGGGYRNERSGGYKSGFGNVGDRSLQDAGFFYPENVETHNLSGLERRKLTWSDPTPANGILEGDLFNDCKDHDTEVEVSVDITVKSTAGPLDEPCQKFEDMDLGPIISDNLRLMKLKKPTPIQRYAIPVIKKGHNILGSAQTGSGKTAAFLIPVIDTMCKEGPPPLLLNDTTSDVLPLTLILSPTRELAVQTFKEAQKLTYRSHIRPYVCYGGSNIGTNIRELQKGTDILVATPGRILDLYDKGVVSMRCIKTLILDEADHMFDTGFSKAVDDICLKSDMPKEKQTLLFSATFPPDIMGLAKDLMNEHGDTTKVAIGRVGSTSDTITQKFISVKNPFQKKPNLLELMETFDKDSKTLIFVKTKVTCRELAEDLTDNGYNAAPINGDLSQPARERTLTRFKSGHTNVLVATEVAARGLDIPMIDQVVNFDMPDTVDRYVHRIGRTGRVGRKGTSISMVNPLKDQHLISGIKKLLTETKQESPEFMSRPSERQSGPSERQHRKNEQYEKRGAEKLPSFQ